MSDALGYYVYLLRDPRDGRVFYVGKGAGSRVFAHVAEAATVAERRKVERIREIQATGADVEHLIVRSGLTTEEEAYVVEQAVIDGLTASGIELTNEVKGHGSQAHGLATVAAAIARYGAPQAPPVIEPTAFFIINRAWRPDMTPMQVYEITRGHWRIGRSSRDRVRYAMGVAYGVVRGAYRVKDWFPSPLPGEAGRWGFNGEAAEEMEGFLGTSVRHLVPERGAQNPVRLYLAEPGPR